MNKTQPTLNYTSHWESSITESIHAVYKQYQQKQWMKQVDYNKAWEFYNHILHKPKYICAPMVNQSELPFRMLCREYNTQLCYTPMMNSKQYIGSDTYRMNAFTTCKQDRPLIAQFCGHDPQVMLQAVKYIENNNDYLADAVDINLGCPQNIARRGVYGAYLMYRPDIVADIVSTLYQNCSIPITCKIRIFDDYSNTLKFAQLLQLCGCTLLTVHGRTKSQNKQTIGMNNLQQIQQLKRDLHIPVICNGGIATIDDVNHVLKTTNIDGVMSSEALLSNPALFSGQHIDSIVMSRKYLAYTQQYPGADSSCIRGHLFKILYHRLSCNTMVRNKLGNCKPDEFVSLIDELAADTQYQQPDMYSTLHWYHRHIVIAERQQINKSTKQPQITADNSNKHDDSESNNSQPPLQKQKLL